MGSHSGGYREKREFQRYDVSHCVEIGGYITEASDRLRLTTLGMGGCGFISPEIDPNLTPPKQVMLSFFENDEKDDIESAQFVVGEIVYLRPSAFSSGTAVQYGIKFKTEDRKQIQPIIAKLESLAASGRVGLA